MPTPGKREEHMNGEETPVMLTTPEERERRGECGLERRNHAVAHAINRGDKLMVNDPQQKC